ncbi:MAG: peptidoglycan DD-metalloendopeptidase family protein [Polyangiaceae bacterium]|nr:peptidoglycan DD-metalloendopeptidase family protein [Polyangiaceae bacterium]
MRRSRAKLLLLVALVSGRALAMDGSPSDPPLGDVVRSITALRLDEERALERLKELNIIQKEAHIRATEQAKVYVRLVRVGLLPLSGGFEQLLHHAQTLERLRHAIERDLKREDDSVSERIKVSQRLAEISSQRAKYAGQEGALRAAEGSLLAARDREASFQRAFGDGAHTATVYGSPNAEPLDPSDLSRGFEVMQGRLPFPIGGRSEIAPAVREQGERHGLEMSAHLGASVRAVYPGRVVFADTYADYGRTVIVDHGGSYFSVSANLGRLDVRVGEQVSTGTRLGTVGASERGALLYFELRRSGVDLDPARWFGI